MSLPNDENDLKGGHPPAAKAGGMRIKGARAHEEKVSKEEYESPWEGEAAKDKAAVLLVSGALTDYNKDYPAAAVRVAHEKPKPTAIKPVQNKQVNRIIQQPR